MSIRRERRGSCQIEARALDLGRGRHWQPWLRLTRCVDSGSASRTFDRLMPLFGTEQAALDYAAELGRSLADEGALLDQSARGRRPAARPLGRTLARQGAYLCRASHAVLAKLMFPVLR